MVTEQPADNLIVVGIGASAGGLEALERFFESVDPATRCAYVIVQHLSPDFRSLMDELLAKHTSLPIHRAEDGMQLEPGHIYLNPPKTDMIVAGDRLVMGEQDKNRLVQVPIDDFFRSMAESVGHLAVAVILSGTGSDGSRGIQAVKEAGGLVLVQEPEEAKFDGMPKSAISATPVDMVLSAAEMGQRIETFAANPFGAVAGEEDSTFDQEPIEGILTKVVAAKGVDFRAYKRRTIERRIHRRRGLLGLDTLQEYARFIESKPDEVDSLFHDILIGVTEFFRDPDCFALIARQVIPALVKQAADGTLRVWIVGCSTGEEVYSVAILIEEYLTARGYDLDYRIFATDIDSRAIARASEGYYPHGIAAAVSPERLERFFEPKGDGYRVVRSLRERIVFAVHDVTKDPPFTRVDLAISRNLLIYFETALQARVLHFLHFALRVHGFLILGPSESLGSLGDEFDVVESRWKFFQKRRDVRLTAGPAIPTERTAGGRAEIFGGARGRSGDPQWLIRAAATLVEDRARAGFLVGPANELIHVFGDAQSILRIPSGQVSTDLLRMVGTEARLALATALHRAGKEPTPIHIRRLRFDDEDPGSVADVTVRRLPDADRSTDDIFLVLVDAFARAPETDGEPIEVDASAQARIDGLEEELRHTKSNLQATIEELETANEELQSSNEELLASNEELQSTNEELHSVNEELYTVNSEHQNKINELTQLHDDLENLLEATEVGCLFLDRDLRIRKFTPAVEGIFSLLEHDVGRPISDLRHALLGTDIVQMARGSLEKNERVEARVVDNRGRPRLLRVLPYSSPKAGGTSRKVEGVLITLFDLVTKQAEVNATLLKGVNEFAAALDLAHAQALRAATPLCVARVRVVTADWKHAGDTGALELRDASNLVAARLLERIENEQFLGWIADDVLVLVSPGTRGYENMLGVEAALNDLLGSQLMLRGRAIELALEAVGHTVQSLPAAAGDWQARLGQIDWRLSFGDAGSAPAPHLEEHTICATAVKRQHDEEAVSLFVGTLLDEDTGERRSSPSAIELFEPELRVRTALDLLARAAGHAQKLEAPPEAAEGIRPVQISASPRLVGHTTPEVVRDALQGGPPLDQVALVFPLNTLPTDLTEVATWADELRALGIEFAVSDWHPTRFGLSVLISTRPSTVFLDRSLTPEHSLPSELAEIIGAIERSNSAVVRTDRAWSAEADALDDLTDRGLLCPFRLASPIDAVP